MMTVSYFSCLIPNIQIKATSVNVLEQKHITKMYSRKHMKEMLMELLIDDDSLTHMWRSFGKEFYQFLKFLGVPKCMLIFGGKSSFLFSHHLLWH